MLCIQEPTSLESPNKQTNVETYKQENKGKRDLGGGVGGVGAEPTETSVAMASIECGGKWGRVRELREECGWRFEDWIWAKNLEAG